MDRSHTPFAAGIFHTSTEFVAGQIQNERKLLEKSVGQLRVAARKVQQMKIPMGTEPAFVFQARLPKK